MSGWSLAWQSFRAGSHSPGPQKTALPILQVAVKGKSYVRPQQLLIHLAPPFSYLSHLAFLCDRMNLLPY